MLDPQVAALGAQLVEVSAQRDASRAAAAAAMDASAESRAEADALNRALLDTWRTLRRN
jgi:hypothetical protein